MKQMKNKMSFLVFIKYNECIENYKKMDEILKTGKLVFSWTRSFIGHFH